VCADIYAGARADDLPGLAALTRGERSRTARHVAMPADGGVGDRRFEITLVPDEALALDDLIVVAAVDVTHTSRRERVLEAHREVVRELAERRPLAAISHAVARLVEAQCDRVRCSVFIISGTDAELAAAPSMPAAWTRTVQQLTGIEYGDDVAALGALPEPLAAVSREHGMRGGRAVPVLDGERRLRALVAWFPDELRFPGPTDIAAVEDAAALCLIALDREVRDPRAPVAGSDPISGVLGRPVFVARVQALLDRGVPIGCVVVRLANLAAINDEFGDAVGDGVLRAVGERIQRVARSRDLVGRTSGATFVIAGTSRRGPVGLEALAERLGLHLRVPVVVAGHTVEPLIALHTAESAGALPGRGYQGRSTVAALLAPTGTTPSPRGATDR
jgi:GGDEF domain-containing protein